MAAQASSRFLELAQNNHLHAISPNEAWNFKTQVLTPRELAEVKSIQLFDRPSHIGILGTAISTFAFLGELDKAKGYYRHQVEMDEDGVRAHLSQVILAVASGQITRSSFLEAGDHGGRFPLASDYDELLHPDNPNDPDLGFNNGVLSLILDDLDTAGHYWGKLTRIDKHKLVTRLHALELFLPDSVLQDPAYAALLERLDVGRSWQRKLMEGVTQMSDITGVALHTKSRSAYDSDAFMSRNNLWRTPEQYAFMVGNADERGL